MEQNTEIQYIAFLRGINVGGKNVKMDKLREIFEEMNLKAVRTYIQSGNVFFRSTESNKDKLKELIEKTLESQLGFNVVVCLRTQDELKHILSLNPFSGYTLTSDTRFAITFLSEESDNKFNVPYLTKDGGYEVIKASKSEIFTIWHLKNGKPANSYNFIEKELKIPTTTRFWHTTEKIYEALMEI